MSDTLDAAESLEPCSTCTHPERDHATKDPSACHAHGCHCRGFTVLVTALVPNDEGRMLPTDAVVALVYLKLDGVTLVAELDYVEDRMPPPRTEMAAVLRDLADAIEASAVESERDGG